MTWRRIAIRLVAMTSHPHLIRACSLAGALVASFVLTGAAAAQIPDGNGVYHACLNKKTGALRLVDPGRRCRRGEQAITFNQSGPAGKDGKDGSNGTNGANGANGTNGTNGANGQNGTTIVDRARSTGQLNTTGSAQDDPLTANTWTQQAGELDEFFGQASISNPSACTMSAAGIAIQGQLTALVYADGVQVGSFFGSPASTTPTVVAMTPTILWEPTAATAQTLTVRASDNCTSGGHMVLNSVALDVAAMR